MSQLKIKNYIIEESVYNILLKLQSELVNGKLSIVENKGDYVRVTCPFHKDGKEHKPSCSVSDNDTLEKGWFHCFTCGEKGNFVKFISACRGTTYWSAEQWLIKNFGIEVDQKFNIDVCQKIEPKKYEDEEILDDSILNSFEDFHPYMEKRKLSKDICKKFEIKYDSKECCLIFPVRDFYGRLIGLSKRNVNYKQFVLPKFKNKPVYLLKDIDISKPVCVCESQINALYLWSLGYQAIALFGTGTKFQYEQLNKSGIKYYKLCFDGDDAGREGAKRFKKYITSNCFIDIINIPENKDVNDLNKQEIEDLLK